MKDERRGRERKGSPRILAGNATDEEVEKFCRAWEAGGRTTSELIDAMEAEDEQEERQEGPGREADLDIVKIYLREIGAYPLLSHEEEMELARRIGEGDRRAYHALVESNLRLVVSIAKRYTGRGVPFSDLIEEGNLGLMKAADKYDWTKGFRFSTYATHWIRQTISRYVDEKSGIIRTPVHMAEQRQKLRRAANSFHQRTGRRPTDAELAQILRLSPEKVRQIRDTVPGTVSLSSPAGEDGDAELIDFLADERAEAPEDQADREIMSDTVASLLDRLAPREREVIRRRFGFGDRDPETLESIGSDMGITRERIRQIEKKALRRLRSPAFARYLTPTTAM